MKPASSLWIRKTNSYWTVHVRVTPNLAGSTTHYRFPTRKAAREFARTL